jgi:hypothetical protein
MLLNNVPNCTRKDEAAEAIQRLLKHMPEPFRKAFGSYHPSLPKDSTNSKAKAGSNQGSAMAKKPFRRPFQQMYERSRSRP